MAWKVDRGAFKPLRESPDYLAERSVVIIDIERLDGMNARLLCGGNHRGGNQRERGRHITEPRYRLGKGQCADQQRSQERELSVNALHIQQSQQAARPDRLLYQQMRFAKV
jgi:hypothetical protein